MSTHKHICIMCGEDVYCCNDFHALGCGASYCDHTLRWRDKVRCIEFCSEECFHALENAMKERWAIYQEIIAPSPKKPLAEEPAQ